MTQVSQLQMGHPSDSDSVDAHNSGDNENYIEISRQHFLLIIHL